MDAYLEMKRRHQNEVNAFPLFFAFTEKQFKEGMAGLGLSPEDTDKIYKFGKTGGFYRKTDADSLWGMLEKHDKELADAIAGDKTGKHFGYNVKTQSIGSGKEGQFTIRTALFNREPIREGDIVRCIGWERNGRYFHMTQYTKI